MRGVLIVLGLLPAVALAQAPPRVEDLRERATAYVLQFIDRFANVVAEERLVQESTSLPSVSGTGTNQKMDVPTPQRREIRSDFLFVRRAATDDWNVYRDAFEVDGRAVRDRGDRLMKLLTDRSLNSEEMARKVATESSRYSIGLTGPRSVNDPVLALVFLQPRFHPRFSFTRGARDSKLGTGVWIVNYQEQVRPTIVRGQGVGDAPSRGRLWIDADTGRVLKTELQVLSSRVETTFTWDEPLGVAVPAEMRDSYMIGRTAFRATATYSRFRRFDVSTTEKIQP